jgi:membrane protein implicated in regulation of membrane protease activity
MLVIFYGQTRIFFAMCRDGLLPERLADVHPRYGTPAKLTIGLGVLIAILAALVPLSPVLPIVGIAFAVFLMTDLPLSTWIRLVIWLAIGLVIYAVYGYRNSRVRMAHGQYGVLPAETTPTGTSTKTPPDEQYGYTRRAGRYRLRRRTWRRRCVGGCTPDRLPSALVASMPSGSPIGGRRPNTSCRRLAV